jgi:hypothetical protein
VRQSTAIWSLLFGRFDGFKDIAEALAASQAVAIDGAKE